MATRPHTQRARSAAVDVFSTRFRNADGAWACVRGRVLGRPPAAPIFSISEPTLYMSSEQDGTFAVDLSDQEAWDDTLLIEAYDRAIRSYQVRTRCPSAAHFAYVF
jgi:hypothetical protein